MAPLTPDLEEGSRTGTIDAASRLQCGMLVHEDDPCPCTLDALVREAGKPWTLAIVGTLGNHQMLRFGKLQDALGNVRSKTLAARLRDLERLGLVHRRSYAEVPPRVEYTLTELGKELNELLQPLMRWTEAQRFECGDCC